MKFDFLRNSISIKYHLENSTIYFKKKTVGVVSGGFDPIHVGHIQMIKEATKQVDELIVILNTDDWLMAKKGYVFMPLFERASIVTQIKGVDGVFVAIDEDDTVCQSLSFLRPDFFFNGGDRKRGNTPEEKVCKKLGIKTVYGVGGGKIQSSSELVRKVKK